MSESRHPYMLISVSKQDYEKVNDILEVFIKWNRIERDNVVVDYNAEDDEYNFDIANICWKTAAFIGDILEASVGHDIGWIHCQLDAETVGMYCQSNGEVVKYDA